MEKVTTIKKNPSSQANKELDEAILRIYQTYGADLSAFFVAVQGLRRESNSSTEVQKDPVRRHA